MEGQPQTQGEDVVMADVGGAAPAEMSQSLSQSQSQQHAKEPAPAAAPTSAPEGSSAAPLPPSSSSSALPPYLPDINLLLDPSSSSSSAAAADRRALLLKREEEDARKDRSLADLLGTLDGYRPVIPEEVTDYYLQRSGFESHDARLNRLLAISAEKFIADIVSDAYQYSRIRTNAVAGRPPGGGAAASGGGGGAAGGFAGAAGGGADAAGGASSQGGTMPGGAQGAAGGVQDRSRTVLTMEDLSAALGEYGVNAKRAESYR